MRKFIITLTTLALSLVMCFSALTGCGLITPNTQRNLEQVVATVQIDENAKKDEIYKKDLVMAYLNGYGTDFNDILNQLVSVRVRVQNAMKSFNEGKKPFENGIQDDTKGVWEVERYLTAPQKLDAEYNAIKAMNDLIKSYVAHEHEEAKEDTIWQDLRTTPSSAAVKEIEIDKQAYVDEGIDTASSNERRVAFNKVIKVLDSNVLLGDYEKTGNVKDTEYYKEMLQSYQESKLLEEYENRISNDIRNTYDFAKLSSAYAEKYEEQKAWSTAEFAEKISSATVSDPIIYGGKGEEGKVTYGYVYNLLLGVNEIQDQKIKAIDTALSKEDKAKERSKILNATIVEDLRSTWIMSGYDFDGTKFTGDFTFIENAGIPFQGKTELVKEATEDSSARYAVKSVDEISLDDFIGLMEEYVYGKKFDKVDTNNVSVYKKVEYKDGVENYVEKINELLFAFSTDPGSLNTNKGYAVKPVPDGADNEQYKIEFAEGARQLLSLGGQSYIIAATDYGYHVMFFSEVLDVNYDFETLEDYLDYEYGDKDWSAKFTDMLSKWNDEKQIKEYSNNYMYLLLKSLSDTAVSNAVTNDEREVMNRYVYEEEGKYVTIYKDRFADLIG